MRSVIILFFMTALSCVSYSQPDLNKEAKAIVKEGKQMYRSEMASWYGTDIVLQKMKGRESEIGGYFSYADGDKTNCVFFTSGDSAKVLASVTFDSSNNAIGAREYVPPRDFSDLERQLYIIREKALTEIRNDTFFQTYKNTDLNLIPLIRNGEKKVYVLTGPKETGVLIFGNDYELTFDANNNIKGKRRIHQNIITSEFGKDKDKKEIGGIHSHLPATGPYITATDICTLMLYEKFAGMQTYYVISKDYVSIWNCDRNELAVITRTAWDKINKDKEKRHPQEKK